MPKYIKMMEGFPWLVTSGIGRMNSFVVCFPKATNCHNKSVTNRQFVPETRSLVSENCSACSFLHVWGFDIINSWRLWRCWRRGLGGHNYNHQYHHLPTTTHPPINHSPTTTEDLYQAPFCWFCFLLFLLEDQVLCQWNMSIHIDDMLFCWMCFFFHSLAPMLEGDEVIDFKLDYVTPLWERYSIHLYPIFKNMNLMIFKT